MTLRNRLLLSYGVVLAIVLLGFFLILAGIIALGQSPERIVTKNYPSILAAERMIQEVQAQQNAILRKLLSAEYDVAGELERAHDEFTTWLKRARLSVTLPSEAETIAAIQRRDQALQTLIADRARWASVYPWETDVVDAFQDVIKACEQLASLNFDAMLEANRNAHERVRSTVLVAAVVATVTLLVGVGVSLGLARRISEPLEQMVEGARRIASGDYQVNIRETAIQEVAQLARQFNAMAEALQRFRAMNLERVVNEQRQSEAVLKSIDDGLVILGQDARIQRLNPVAARQLGLAPEQCTGKSLDELLGDPHVDAEVRRCLGLSTAAGNAPLEIQVGDEHDPRYLAYSVVPIIDDDGRRRGAVMVIRDITEHKAFEQMRTELVMRASHELRTPLTSIRMGIGMIREKTPFAKDSREQVLLETVNEELTRLMRLVNDLFDLSRFQAGRQELELTPCNVRELLESAHQRFALKAAERGLSLTLAIEDSTPQIRIDRSQLERVLDNLLTNALRHTPKGGRVTLCARDNGSWVTIKVADTGCGIDYAQQYRVFEPFVQITDNSGGAGLGLAICKEIVQQHGGRITLRSAPAQGATFYIRLPAFTGRASAHSCQHL